MKEKNKYIAAVIAVITIIGIVAGGTYAFWRWTSSTSEKTTVNFTVDAGLSATLNGGTLSVGKLAPVSSCTNSAYATKAPVTLTYSNNSGATAKAKGTLTVTTFTVASGHSDFKTNDLTHLHYALTTSNSSCTTGAISGATGTFNGKNSAGSILINDAVLQDNIATGTTNATKNMYLYIWLDDGYEFTNVGSQSVTDPMQDLEIVLTWTGSITNTQTT